jgi:hypothetical protein
MTENLYLWGPAASANPLAYAAAVAAFRRRFRRPSSPRASSPARCE